MPGEKNINGGNYYFPFDQEKIMKALMQKLTGLNKKGNCYGFSYLFIIYFLMNKIPEFIKTFNNVLAVNSIKNDIQKRDLFLISDNKIVLNEELANSFINLPVVIKNNGKLFLCDEIYKDGSKKRVITNLSYLCGSYGLDLTFIESLFKNLADGQSYTVEAPDVPEKVAEIISLNNKYLLDVPQIINNIALLQDSQSIKGGRTIIDALNLFIPQELAKRSGLSEFYREDKNSATNELIFSPGYGEVRVFYDRSNKTVIDASIFKWLQQFKVVRIDYLSHSMVIGIDENGVYCFDPNKHLFYIYYDEKKKRAVFPKREELQGFDQENNALPEKISDKNEALCRALNQWILYMADCLTESDDCGFISPIAFTGYAPSSCEIIEKRDFISAEEQFLKWLSNNEKNFFKINALSLNFIDYDFSNVDFKNKKNIHLFFALFNAKSFLSLVENKSFNGSNFFVGCEVRGGEIKNCNFTNVKNPGVFKGKKRKVHFINVSFDMKSFKSLRCNPAYVWLFYNCKVDDKELIDDVDKIKFNFSTTGQFNQTFFAGEPFSKWVMNVIWRAKLKGCTISDLRIGDCSFDKGCFIEGTTFENVEFYDIDFGEIDLTGTTFNKVSFYGKSLKSLLKNKTFDPKKLIGCICKYFKKISGRNFGYAVHGVEFSDGVFEKIVFKGANLQDVLFENITFKKVNFGGANLTGAQFKDASFDKESFESLLENETFTGGFKRCYLRQNSDNKNSKLLIGKKGLSEKNCQGEEAETLFNEKVFLKKIKKCKIYEANINDCIFYDDVVGTEFNYVKISNVDFGKIDLAGTTFNEVSFCDKSLESLLKNKTFNGSLAGCSLDGGGKTNEFSFSYDNFSGMRIDNIKIDGGDIKNVNFSGTKFSNVVVKNTVFKNCVFTKCDFSGDVIFDNVTFDDCDFSGANCKNVKFVNKTSLQGILVDKGTNFAETKFYNDSSWLQDVISEQWPLSNGSGAKLFNRIFTQCFKLNLNCQKNLTQSIGSFFYWNAQRTKKEKQCIEIIKYHLYVLSQNQGSAMGDAAKVRKAMSDIVDTLFPGSKPFSSSKFLYSSAAKKTVEIMLFFVDFFGMGREDKLVSKLKDIKERMEQPKKNDNSANGLSKNNFSLRRP